MKQKLIGLAALIASITFITSIPALPPPQPMLIAQAETANKYVGIRYERVGTMRNAIAINTHKSRSIRVWVKVRISRIGVSSHVTAVPSFLLGPGEEKGVGGVDVFWGDITAWIDNAVFVP